ncbi:MULTISPECIES: PucR family transcriptional regulator [Clostridium]|uniref:PucR family transcriptional regulator n=1 Tax=Clostridium TaxID=1485 RepID=UPI000A4F63A9|nr:MULTISPECIES: helix-turn-helix domain-containing protein [Clostridium]PJI10452.1 regulator of polyketide synthase expression [Clostridium sp. CT7]
MKILIDSIIEKLKQYNPKSYINNKNITLIKSIKYLESNIKDFYPNTLYMVKTLDNNKINNLVLHETNFLIVSKTQLSGSIEINKNSNIIFICSNSAASIFNEVLGIFFEYQTLNVNSLKLLEVLSQNTGLQNIVNIASKSIGNPIFISNTNFKVLSFTDNIKVDAPVWKGITSKTYKRYDNLQRILKDNIFDSRIPIYFKSTNSASYNFDDLDKLEDRITKNSESVLYKESDKFIMSRMWSNIYAGNKLLGQAIILEAFKPFTERDIKLINILSDAISVELQKHNYYESTDISNKDLLILELLDGKISCEEDINETAKFTHLNLKYPLNVISVISKKNISYVQFKYIRDFFENIFYNSICVLYKGNIAIVTSCIQDKLLYENCFKKLNKVLSNLEMFCGVSRPFYNLISINKYYKQSLKSIELGQCLDDNKYIFFYDSYILQHIFSVCSREGSLKDFCHPSIFKLIDYDNMYKTDYLKNLYLYVTNFKNQSKLAELMHVHRNTLRYRISKIEEIMNVDLNNVDEFFSIYLSFKILEYLGEDIC